MKKEYISHLTIRSSNNEWRIATFIYCIHIGAVLNKNLDNPSKSYE